MEKVKIPLKGIDTQASDVFGADDGTCLNLENVRPAGNPSNPRWEIVPEKSSVPFNLEHADGDDTTQVKSAYLFQGNWYVVVRRLDASVDLGVEYLRIYKCSLNGGNWEYDTLLFEEEYVSPFNSYDFKWTEANGKLYINFIPSPYNSDYFPYVFVLGKSSVHPYPDVLIPSVVPPFICPIKVSLETQTWTVDNFEKYFSNGRYAGFLNNKDKYIGIIYALKVREGVYIKHTQPHILEIPEYGSLSAGTDIQFSTLLFEFNDDYADNDSNYEDNVSLFDTYQFPYSLSGQTLTDTFSHHLHENGIRRISDIGIFITRPVDSFKKAVSENNYYYIGTSYSDGFRWKDNEETIVTGEVLNIDPFSHHVVMPKILGEYRNNLTYSQIVTNFALPGWEWVNEKGRVLINEDSPGETTKYNHECAVVVTISVNGTLYTRLNKISLKYYNNPGPQVSIPAQLSYPDQRAYNIKIYWYDDSNGMYYLLSAKRLQPHPYLNMSYNYQEASDVETPGTGNVTLDFSANEEYLVEDNNVKISDITHLAFPLERTYKFQDKIFGVIDNLDEVGSGQFGDYPVYFLGEKKIFGGKSTGEAFISKIDMICSTHGVKGPFAFTIYKNALWFASDYGVHIMQGSVITDIYTKIEDTATYNLNFLDDVLSVTKASPFQFLIDGSDTVHVECNPRSDEVVFCAPNNAAGAYVYNLKYKTWYLTVFYKFSNTEYSNKFGQSCYPTRIGNNLYLLGSNGGYDLNEGLGLFDQGFLIDWNNEEDAGSFQLITNPMVLNDYSSMKALKTSIMEGVFSLAADSELRVYLQGKRTTHDDWITLHSYTENTEQTIKSFYIKSNYGSMQAYRLIIQGIAVGSDTYLGNILVHYLPKNRNLKK